MALLKKNLKRLIKKRACEMSTLIVLKSDLIK